jgi:DHA1 family bicyclomycin/chloramphenicol resistance-like MFS transporter
MPMLAPALGAVIIVLAGWRIIHLLMAVGGLLLAATVSLFVGESRPVQTRSRSTGIGFADGFEMLRDRFFRRIAIVNALSYASIFAYIAGAPVVVISQFNYTNAVYAVVFACTAAALTAGAMANARLARRLDCQTLVWPALVTQAAANAGLVIGAIEAPVIGPWILLPLLLIGCFARGIISPNLVHAAISTHRDNAGLAAALVGLMQLAMAAAASALLARLLNQFGAVSVATTMAALSVAAMMLWMATKLGSVIAERS